MPRLPTAEKAAPRPRPHQDGAAPRPRRRLRRRSSSRSSPCSSRPEGASLAELVAATGWQAHSVRGALAGSLKRKGHAIVSEKLDGERRYRIGAGQ